MSVGVLGGKAVGIVEIKPKVQAFLTTRANTHKGASEYTAPAPSSRHLSMPGSSLRPRPPSPHAVAATSPASTSWFSSVGEPFLLEINTLPRHEGDAACCRCALAARDWILRPLVKEMVSPRSGAFPSKRRLASPMNKDLSFHARDPQLEIPSKSDRARCPVRVGGE